TLFIAKGSPWENGYVESFNGTLRDELLNREIFLSFEEARLVIDRWRLDYNHHRIHSSLDYQTPAAYAAGCALPASASATPQTPDTQPLYQPQFSHSTWCKDWGVVKSCFRVVRPSKILSLTMVQFYWRNSAMLCGPGRIVTT
ncbi:MAG: hypothetical protein CMM07_07070, partial [Rhodopirellula sp.]|nr:hypothetical protein [Rhodopirellula sp.]